MERLLRMSLRHGRMSNSLATVLMHGASLSTTTHSPTRTLQLHTLGTLVTEQHPASSLRFARTKTSDSTTQHFELKTKAAHGLMWMSCN